METFNIIAGLASIIALFLSLFAVTQVVKIKNSLKVHNSVSTVTDNSVKRNKQVVKGSDNKVAGRDVNGN